MSISTLIPAYIYLWFHSGFNRVLVGFHSETHRRKAGVNRSNDKMTIGVGIGEP
jgi:hypothetical protein